jgi:hypothetical protein
MADFTADITTTSSLDGYQSQTLSSNITMVAANGAFTLPIVSTGILVLYPTVRDNLPGAASTTYYYMRGKDVDCGTVTYRYWVVTQTPDPLGAQYVGSKCGGSVFADVVVEHTWTVTA